MESLYFWVPMVLVLSGIGIAVYVWAVNDGQYDDLDRQAEQMLMEDDDQTHVGANPRVRPDSMDGQTQGSASTGKKQ